MALRRLAKERQDLQNNPLQTIIAGPVNNNDILRWHAMIQGPPNTPYENGIFKIEMKFPQQYPFKPPKVKFLTKVYHFNVTDAGEICLDLLKDHWSPAVKISQLLISIQSLLIDGNSDNPLVPQIAKLYKENKDQYDKTAREWTQRYAQ